MFNICENDLQNILSEILNFVPIAMPAVISFLGVKIAIRYIINLINRA